MSTISTTVTNTVTLGNGIYDNSLTITSQGKVQLAAYSGSVGIDTDMSGSYLNDSGSIFGGSGTLGNGSIGGAGGIGVDLTGAATVVINGAFQNGVFHEGNFAGVSGGNGTGYSKINTSLTGGGAGGIAVDLSGAGASLYNAGGIQGGTGANSKNQASGAGGNGVTFGGSTLTNVGNIYGGGGGYVYGTSGKGGAGGLGLYVNSAAKVVNNYTIAGGGGGGGNLIETAFGAIQGGQGGVGVFINAPGATFSNNHIVRGGNGGYGGSGGGGEGSDGVVFGGSTMTNSDYIRGGGGGDVSNFMNYQGGLGGDGVALTGSATLTNESGATIVGGAGGGHLFSTQDSTQFASNAYAGAGVLVATSTSLINDGTISGGRSILSGKDTGGAGVYETGGTFTNDTTGTLNGGAGGGVGLHLTAGSATNDGKIQGANKTYGYQGAGVDQQGGTLTNAVGATIAGGKYAVGVLLDGGTLTTYGAINGGGQETSSNTPTGYSVQFGPSAASTLVVGNHASFSGAIGGFNQHDTIDITNLDPTTVENDFKNDTITTATDGTLVFDGNFSGEHFVFKGDGGSGTDVTLATGSPAVYVISDNVTQPVLLGTALYPGPLTITASGAVDPSAANGADAIDSQVAGSSLTNSGTVLAATGAYGASYGQTGGIGVNLSGAATVTNSGSISGGTGGASGASGTAGYGGVGVQLLDSGAILTNTNTGSISGGIGGAGAMGGTGVVLDNAGNGETNGGTIAGGAGGYTAVGTAGGGGLGLSLTGGTFTNSGTISGGAGGNTADTATGAYAGAGGNGANVTGGTLINTGSISTGLDGSGANGGFSGAQGVDLNGGTLENSGTITGSNFGGFDSVLFGAAAGTLIVDPGAIFNGAVQANSSVDDILELSGQQIQTGTPILLGPALPANGQGAGTPPPGEFVNFSTLDFAPGAAWTVDATQAALTSQPLTIEGFTTSDTLDITDLAPATAHLSFDSSTDVLTVTGGGTTIDLQFSGNFNGAQFALSSDGNGGTDIALCFCKGTRIATPAGERPVEQLRVGDLVSTLQGPAQKIKWIGTREYDGRFIAGNHLMLPICIRAGALDAGVPARDLIVSPGHGILQDGVLVPAWRLVNGVTITQAKSVAQVSYYHIECEAHEILLAENCPAESFFDAALRGQFQNARTYDDLYCAPQAPKAPLPRLESGFLLQAIQRRLAGRAGISQPPARSGRLRGFVDGAGPLSVAGWAQDESAPEEPVSLDIVVNGKRVSRVLANHYRADLRAAGLGSGCHAFECTLDAPALGPIEVHRSSDGARLDLTTIAAVSVVGQGVADCRASSFRMVPSR